MRAMLSWILPAVATFAAWWIFLGVDEDDQYTVGQVAGLVVVLLVIGIVCGWLARRNDLLPFVVSTTMGVAVACWTGWSDDESGLFVVGWILVTVAMALVATAVIVGSWAMRRRLSADDGRVG